MTKLFTDTSANLPLSLLTAHHIEVLPFSYTVDGKPVPYSETTDFDGKAFTTQCVPARWSRPR